MFLLVALSLGFLGSFHCIGMCGPIALAIPLKRTSTFALLSSSFIYNLGRSLTYSIMGLLFGLLGKGFVLAGWQNVLSITLGIGILLSLFIPNLPLLHNSSNLILRLLSKLKLHLSTLFNSYSKKSLLLIGLLNGLLPCGLVYLAIAGAIATGDAVKGAMFMYVFGLGTFPTMLSLAIARDYISISFRKRIRKVIPVFVGTMAIMLILRGMNLGIPYISPTMETSGGISHHKCCINSK